MNKDKLKQYKTNKAEFRLNEHSITMLQERLSNVPVISGKVMKSSEDFPYIEQRMTVQMQEPKTAAELKKRIREKEIRKDLLQREMQEVEDFIAEMPEGIKKRIFELVYLDGFTQAEAAEAVGYTQARVSQIVNGSAKDL